MKSIVRHISHEQLEKAWPQLKSSPREKNRLDMIVIRPAPNERRVLEKGTLDVTDGLLGDGWKDRASSSRKDGQPHPGKQVTIMNSRVIQLIAGDPSRWPLAGDQLYIDLDLSEDNLNPGDRIRIGEAILEVTGVPHTGCKKFVERYGLDAMKFVNSPEGRKYNLRGINVRVVQGGVINTGDLVEKC